MTKKNDKKLLFDAQQLSGCCLITTMYNMELVDADKSEAGFDEKVKTKAGVRRVAKSRVTSTMYATHVQGNPITNFLLNELDFEIIDVNFNPNSGNNVYTMKYVAEF